MSDPSLSFRHENARGLHQQTFPLHWRIWQSMKEKRGLFELITIDVSVTALRWHYPKMLANESKGVCLSLTHAYLITGQGSGYKMSSVVTGV